MEIGDSTRMMQSLKALAATVRGFGGERQITFLKFSITKNRTLTVIMLLVCQLSIECSASGSLTNINHAAHACNTVYLQTYLSALWAHN